VLFAEPRGPEVVLTVEVASVKLKVVAPSTGYPEEGAATGLGVDFDALVFFNGDTNRRIEVRLPGRPS
jgi:multiple sugar transport system ATP-binding protein